MPAASCAPFPACATSAPISDARSAVTSPTASISPRTGSASIPRSDYDKTRASVEAAVAGYPGLYRDVQTYLRERIKEVLTGAGESIVVRIFGPELPVLRR